MRLHNTFSGLVIGLIFSAKLVAAPSITISGNLPGSIQLHTNKTQAITLQKIKLSKAAKTYLLSHLDNLNEKSPNLAFNLPPNVNLGMENVPVLQQGEQNTCVTFAVTGAINAMLKRQLYQSVMQFRIRCLF